MCWALKFRAPKLFRHRSCDEFLRGSSLIFSLLVNVGFRGGLTVSCEKDVGEVGDDELERDHEC